MLVLEGEKASSNEERLTAILDLLLIPWKAVSCGQAGNEFSAGDHPGEVCILGSAPALANVLRPSTGINAELPLWIKQAHSVYVFGFQATKASETLLRLLCASDSIGVRTTAAPTTGYNVSIAESLDYFCGPMSGLRFQVNADREEVRFVQPAQKSTSQTIISTDSGGLFVCSSERGVRFFFSSCADITDVRTQAKRFFDVKEHFAGTVPTVMYLTWAFGKRKPVSACLIVDDPLLRPRYGFLRFTEALKLMDAEQFTLCLAFIPWNWRRTDKGTAQQFKTRADKLSVCIHGCDHSWGEFASRSSAILNGRAKRARRRMELFSRTTLVSHDPIMVFPQGLFSPEVGRSLKLNSFTAAVNTEVCPSGGAGNQTTISDLWKVANAKYGTFAIFSRRYISQGVENFAFDALLGKPCLIVGHHDVFRDDAAELIAFVRKLNSLKWDLRWRSLGDAIRRSYQPVASRGGQATIKMFGAELLLENDLAIPMEAVVRKDEEDGDCLEAVEAAGIPVKYECNRGILQFRVIVPPQECAVIRVKYLDRLPTDSSADGIRYRSQIAVRRYLSEFRDNYVSQSALLEETVARLRKRPRKERY